jgi:RimJ/RimL family protein N-acetyltransferase
VRGTRASDPPLEGRPAGAPRATSPPRELPAGPVSLRAFLGAEGPILNGLVTRNLEHLRPWMPWAREDPSEQLNVEFVHHLVEEWDSGVGFGYWLCEVASGEMVGCAGLHRRVGPGGLEIGYWVSADRVRRGYATATAQALTTAAFGLPGIERTEIHCDAANVASAAVPKRLGYRLDRVDPIAPRASSESGRKLVWVVDVASWVTATSR